MGGPAREVASGFVLRRAVGSLIQPAPLHAQEATGAVTKVRLRERVADIFFLNAKLGWAVTETGSVLRTRDGGKRWEANPDRVGEGYDRERTVEFASAVDGIISTSDRAFYTSDGGRTWIPGVEIGNLTPARIVGGSTGYALIGPAKRLKRTDDAGKTWQDVTLPPDPGRLGGWYFRDAQTGWLSFDRADHTAIWRTRDGARSWALLSDSLAPLLILPLRAGGPLIAYYPHERDFLVLMGFYARSNDGVVWDTLSLPIETPTVNTLATTPNGQIWAAGDGGTLLTSPDGIRDWRMLAGGRSVLGVDFVDRSRGWAVGSEGLVLSSRDGGTTWVPQESGTRADLVDVAFTSPARGWAVANSGVVVRTVNGGRTWESRVIGSIPENSPLASVQFSDSLSGWIAGPRTLLITSDGGRNWREPSVPPPALDHLHFITPQTGWASGYDGLFRSADGGRTWTSVPRPPELSDGGSAIWFTSDSAGWIASGGTLYRTVNTGRSWTRQVLGNAAIKAVRFADESTGYAVGEDGTVYNTVNGGGEWRREKVPTTRDLYDIDVAGDNSWAVGAGGQVVRRLDGEWRALDTTIGPAPWMYVVLTLLCAGLVFAARADSHSNRIARPRDAARIEHLLISDRPLQPGDPDPFELNALALGVSKFLRNSRTRPPLTMAITGKWGTGKSSLMNLIRRDLEASHFRPVWFNAWHHQKEEHLLAALLETIRAQAVPRTLTPSGLMFRGRLLMIRLKRHRPAAIMVCVITAFFVGYLAADLNRVATLWAAVRTAAVNPSTAFTAFVDSIAAGFDPQGGGALPFFTLATLGFGVTLWRALRAFGVKPAALMASLTSRVRLRDLEAQTGFRYRFAVEFSEVTEALHPLDMVLFVDDLDRCRPEQVLEVLESINFLVSSGDCVVVMGMDRDWVMRCVGLAFDQIAQETADPEHGSAAAGEAGEAGEDVKRSNRGEFAAHYLEKLVNIDIPVPEPTRAQRQSFVATNDRTGQAPSRSRESIRSRSLRLVHDARTVTSGLYLAVAIGFFTLAYIGTQPHDEPMAEPFVVAQAPPPAAVAQSDSAQAQPKPTVAQGPPQPSGREGLLLGVPVETAFRGPAAAAIAVLLLVGVSLLRRRDSLVRDSQTFIDALEAWSGVIASQNYTPRTTKKFLNRLRYYAMRQRALEPAETRARQIGRIVGRLRDELLPESGPPDPEARVGMERGSAPPLSIPEPILVALACLHECCKPGIPKAAFEDFHTFVQSDSRTAEFSKQILHPDLNYPRSLASYKARFEEISAGVRIH